MAEPTNAQIVNGFYRRILPDDVTPQTVTTNQAFGPFDKDDYITVVCDSDFNLNSGTSATPDADANDPQFLKGDHDFAITADGTYVYVLGASGAKAWVYKSNG